MRNYLLAVLLLFFVQGVSAADYYWSVSSAGSSFKNVSSLKFANPSAGCSVIPGYYENASYTATGSSSIISVAQNKATCQVFVSFNSTGVITSLNVVFTRYGDSCPSGSTYDAATGECKTQCSAGMTTTARGPDAGFGVSSSGQIYSTSRLESVCLDSCSYDRNALSGDCFFVSGSTTTTFCNLYFTSNGDSCSVDDWNAPDTGDPLTITDPSQCPDGTSLQGGQCLPVDDGGDDECLEGEDCDDDGGDDGCTPGEDGCDDGSGPPGGDGDGDGDGGGDGDGNGGSGGGPGDGDGLSGGCEGESCQFEDKNHYGDDVVPGYGETLSNIYKGIKASPIGQSISDISFPSGGSCPSGSVNLFGASIQFDAHCDLFDKIAPILRLVFLACWALLAVRIFLSA